MANNTIDMNKIRKVIKLHCGGKSKLFISKYLSLSRNTVKKYISLFEVLGLSLGSINQKTDAELDALFSQNAEEITTPRMQKAYEFFPQMERELKKTGVTMYGMWERYISLNPDGFRISQFRSHYLKWSNKVNPVMHMIHKAGDKMYVDYARKTLSIVDKSTSEIKEVQFFVAILGASQYTYAEVSISQQKEDFVASAENAIHFLKALLPQLCRTI